MEEGGEGEFDVKDVEYNGDHGVRKNGRIHEMCDILYIYFQVRKQIIWLNRLYLFCMTKTLSFLR